MQYFSDEQLDDMFRLLDFDQLEQLGYKMDIYTPDELEDFMITIEEEFSELDRDDKIAELRQIGAFDDDYLVDEVKMGAEEVSGDITFTARQFVDKLHDVDVKMYEDALDTVAWEGYGRVGTWSDDGLGNMILHEDESMSAESANPTGGATGDQIVSWEHNGLSSPSGPPSDIFWSELDAEGYGDVSKYVSIDFTWDYSGEHEEAVSDGDYYITDQIKDLVESEVENGEYSGNGYYSYTVEIEDDKGDITEEDVDIDYSWG